MVINYERTISPSVCRFFRALPFRREHVRVFRNPKCSSGHVQCSFGSPTRNFFYTGRKIFAHRPKKVKFPAKMFLAQRSKTFVSKNDKVYDFKQKIKSFPNSSQIYNLELWFCWMLKLSCLKKYSVQYFHQGLNRQIFTWGGLFRPNIIIFLLWTWILTGRKYKKRYCWIQILVFKAMIFQNNLLDFLNKWINRELLTLEKLLNKNLIGFVPSLGIFIVQKL